MDRCHCRLGADYSPSGHGTVKFKSELLFEDMIRTEAYLIRLLWLLKSVETRLASVQVWHGQLMRRGGKCVAVKPP